MPADIPVTLTINAEAVQAFRRMTRSMDQLLALAAGNRGRYENATNAYEAALEDAYAKWLKGLAKIAGTDAEKRAAIETALADLQRTLQQLGQENLPDTLYVLGHNYVPSADAFQMVADVIRENDALITARLIPDLREKLYRALDEEADLAGVGQSLAARVTGLAGIYWTTIQRAIGDFAEQAKTADDEVYACRWVLDPGAEHCEACSEFAGTYASYNAMLEATGQCVPGYFFGYRGRACWANCRCHLELKIKDVWVRV